MNPNAPDNTNTQTHNTHNPLTGDGVTNTHNPFTGDRTGPQPAPGTNPITGRTKNDNFGHNEQQRPDTHHISGTGAGVISGTNTRSAGHPPAGDGVTSRYNPTTNDKTGPNSLGPDAATGRTDDYLHGGNRDTNERKSAGYTGITGAHTGTQAGAGVGPTSGTNTHNTHNPLTGDGVSNTHNPMTGDKAGPRLLSGTDPVAGRADDGNLGRHEQQPAGYTDTTGAHSGTHTAAAHKGTHTGAGAGVTSGTNTHNTHNPLTGDGVIDTHNPMTGDKTGPHLVTGRTNEGNFGRHEQQPAGYTNTTGAHTGTHTGTDAGVTPDTNTHNTHNPLTGDGVTNTHNPLTGNKAGPQPPTGTNPVTGRTNDGNLGHNEQQPAGHTGITGTGPHDRGIHDTTQGGGTAGGGTTTGTGPHTSTKASGGGAKAAIGRIEATLGAMINNSEMHAKGVQKQDEAQAAKLAKEQEAAHGGADVRH